MLEKTQIVKNFLKLDYVGECTQLISCTHRYIRLRYDPDAQIFHTSERHLENLSVQLEEKHFIKISIFENLECIMCINHI